VIDRRTTQWSGNIGLYHAGDFRLTDGHCVDCGVLPQALWYFRDETIAVPKPGIPVSGFARGVNAFDDVRRWSAADAPGTPPDRPSLIWIGSPAELRGARLDASGSRITATGDTISFEVVDKIPLNRSYYNAASVAFLAARPLKVRGDMDDDTFTARSIWPEDFRLEANAPDSPAADAVAATPEGIRALLRADPRGGALSGFAATTLWERTPGAARDCAGKPALAVMLNGAQGDDDEAHGGHFAVVTGRVGPNGAIDDWLANNFYTLDLFSEKGIIAAPVPLDRYLTDLNSGQAWYRPSHLMVAVLDRERTASHLQGGLNRVYNQFYRHQLAYGNVTMNCAGISVDALRTLGWNVRARGPTSRTLAWLGMPWFAIHERSMVKAQQTFDYLSEDRTRVFPAAAFEECAADLLALATGKTARDLAPFETMLVEDIVAMLWLRIPQLPSSRAWGDYAVVTRREYAARLPADRSEAKIIPVPPRPFPPELRDPDLLPTRRGASAWAMAAWAALGLTGVPWLIWRLSAG
jgi:hypothetical protein